jgi:hypothetical protein
MKMNKMPWCVLGLMLLFGLSACQQTTVVDVATTDAFIKTIINQGDTLFGLAHSAFSYNRMSSVSVKTPAGDSIPLTGIADGGLSIYKDPSVALGEYSKVLPIAGLYTYDVTFKDKTQRVLSNTLGADFLAPAVIDSLVKSGDGQSVILKWSAVPGAQLYQIRVTKGNTEVIPATLYSPAEELAVQFPITSFSRYSPGTFTIELDALLYESADLLLLQAMGISYGSINLP